MDRINDLKPRGWADLDMMLAVVCSGPTVCLALHLNP